MENMGNFDRWAEISFGSNEAGKSGSAMLPSPLIVSTPQLEANFSLKTPDISNGIQGLALYLRGDLGVLEQGCDDVVAVPEMEPEIAPVDPGHALMEELDDASDAPGVVSTTQSLVVRVADNDKRELDAQWPEHLLTMETAALKKFLRTSHYTDDEVKELKAARRRLKNRQYQETARQKRKQKLATIEQERSQAGQNNALLKAQVSKLRNEIHTLRQENEALVRLIHQCGRVPKGDLASVPSGMSC